jgi:hypothetical protein
MISPPQKAIDFRDNLFALDEKYYAPILQRKVGEMVVAQIERGAHKSAIHLAIV